VASVRVWQGDFQDEWGPGATVPLDGCHRLLCRPGGCQAVQAYKSDDQAHYQYQAAQDVERVKLCRRCVERVKLRRCCAAQEPGVEYKPDAGQGQDEPQGWTVSLLVRAECVRQALHL